MEELKLILNAVGNLGEAGKWMFIAYLLKESCIHLFGFTCLFYGIRIMSAILTPLASNSSFISEIGDSVGFSTPLSRREKDAILKKLREKGE